MHTLQPRFTDTGLFGPDSVTWRLHGDPAVMWVGGLRALLLQALHPLAMAGVDQHSDFRDDPWGRLQRTGDYVATLTFADRPTARRAAAAVRRAHHGLAGIEPESGRPYRVSDPDLLLWVHCCEVDSFLSVARRSGPALSDGDADRYVAEQVVAARLVGVPPQRVPDSAAALEDYFHTVRTELRCTAAARRAALFLLWPPMATTVQLLTPARPAWTALATLAVATLPRWARTLYGLPALRTTDWSTTPTLYGFRLLGQTLPDSWRHHPYHVRALEQCRIRQREEEAGVVRSHARR
ncbi:uncharacterized protein (DUF2236 family) [Halopolyspora algeriensis]|uniref:Uncharacterized protein (DUF2236 family) n=1 Tax=Halopolyspora algeriensis TaxID=1500506 RepID=A0A368VN38_9ACTN|nr:oxygenase MpaB family protein [Halopolyspora algeriensis]RCW43131.1 uncharacterized protein (DUF2236 family) [Halopolyspora algeriensis]TQM56189.1 uncharacterized protein (DUF2236 family) [Halopolyspora algeriensis]